MNREEYFVPQIRLLTINVEQGFETSLEDSDEQPEIDW